MCLEKKYIHNIYICVCTYTYIYNMQDYIFVYIHVHLQITIMEKEKPKKRRKIGKCIKKRKMKKKRSSGKRRKKKKKTWNIIMWTSIVVVRIEGIHRDIEGIQGGFGRVSVCIMKVSCEKKREREEKKVRHGKMEKATKMGMEEQKAQ